MAQLSVKVVPGASRAEISGRHGDGIKVRVTAPPEGGRANAELLELVAAALDVPRRTVTLVRGHGSQRKVLQIEGLDARAVLERLGL